MKFESIAALRPVISAKVGGSEVGVSFFRLLTDRDIPLSLGELRMPGKASTDYADATVAVKFGFRDLATWTAFTGWADRSFFDGRETTLVLRECPKKFTEGEVSLSYRKEAASRILSDILDAGGVSTKKVTVPSVKLDRFAVEKVSPFEAVQKLIGAIGSYEDASKIRYFFDEAGAFRFGTPDDTGKNEGEAVEFDEGAGIIAQGDGVVEVPPAPLRHSQAFTLKGSSVTSFRTRLTASPARSRLEVWYA
jgi:hypothetical protein